MAKCPACSKDVKFLDALIYNMKFHMWRLKDGSIFCNHCDKKLRMVYSVGAVMILVFSFLAFFVYAVFMGTNIYEHTVPENRNESSLLFIGLPFIVVMQIAHFIAWSKYVEFTIYKQE